MIQMKYLTDTKSINIEFIVKHLNKDAFEKYKCLTIDERLWSNEPLYNYEAIVRETYKTYTKYADLINVLRQLNVELFNNKIVVMNEYWIYEEYKKLNQISN